MSKQIGLRDFHIALLTKDDKTAATYETPEKLERAIMAKITPKVSTSKEYSDDNLEEIIDIFDCVDVEIELNQLSLASRAKLQGAKLVKGALKETKNDIAPYLAMGFRSKKKNGTYRYVWLYKGKFELTSDEYETTKDKVKAQNSKLKGTFFARDYDEAYRLIMDEDETGVDAVTLEAWFTAVQDQPTEAA